MINKFTRIPDYKMAVLPLIEVLHNTSSSGKQFLGNIIFGRGNSAYHGSIISIRVNDPAGDYYAGFNLMKMGPMLSGTTLDINPCVFKYNNKWYAGLKIVVVNSAINISIQGQFNDTSYSSNNFYGEIINYATHTGGTVSSIDNQEIYDSIDTDRANLEIYDTDIWKLKNESTLYSLIEYHNDSTHNLYGWFRCFKIYTGASLVIKFEFTRGWGNGEGFTYSIVLTNSVNNTLERKLSVLKMPNGPYYQSYDCILKMRLVAAGTANEYYVDFYVDNMNSDRSIASHNYYGITMSYINLSTTGYYGNALSSFMSHTDSYSKNHISEPGGDIFAEYDLVDLLMRADVNRSFTFNCATISHGQSNLFSQNGEFIIDISNKRYVYYRADMGNTPTLFILGYPLMKSGSGGNQPLAFGMVDTNADMQIFYQSDNSLHFTVAKVISGGIPYIQFSLAYSSATVFLLSPRKVPIYHSTTALTPDP